MKNIRNQFSILKEKFNGHPLIYFDSAATSQKPQIVLDTLNAFYEKMNANVHRSLNPLGEMATVAYESSRKTVAQFIGAKNEHEIVFTKSATEGINLVAKTWGKKFLQKGDRIVLPISEHHSNIVPWLQLKEEIGIHVDFISLNRKKNGLDMEVAQKLIAKSKTKLVAFGHSSNALGILLPVKKLIWLAKQQDALTLVDAAASCAHVPLNVSELDCDFLVFSPHKCFGTMGTGILYAKENHLESMPPFLGGGEMIREVFKDTFTVNEVPHKFEAGTPNVSGIVALSAAIHFIQELGWSRIQKIEGELTQYLFSQIDKLAFVERFGEINAKQSLPTALFSIPGIHAHDIGELLGQEGVMIRSGHHCAQPLHKELGVVATARASLSIYNTKEEIDTFVEVLKKIHKYFK